MKHPKGMDCPAKIVLRVIHERAEWSKIKPSKNLFTFEMLTDLCTVGIECEDAFDKTFKGLIKKAESR